MTIHETRTPLPPATVIELARSFFPLAGSSYAGFPEQGGEAYLKLHMEVGEILIAALPRGEETWVRATASRGGHLVTRFLTLLAPPLDAQQTAHRYRHHMTHGAAVETLAGSDPAQESTARAA